MRLTLRTLLAYLDDRLTPANAKEIGHKITNSPFATDLVERIRDVKRRRRLASPEKAQPTIDANLVAEYLDDQLTPELVARVEREILSSDVMLAEVAAAHEIIGLLRDPMNVEPRLRDRLYGMDPTGHTDLLRASGQEATAAPPAKAAVPQWKPLAAPTQRSNQLPAILIAILVIVWLVSVVSDSGLVRPAAVAKIDANPQGNPAEPQNPENGAQVADVAGAEKPDTAVAESGVPAEIPATDVASNEKEKVPAPAANNDTPESSIPMDTPAAAPADSPAAPSTEIAKAEPKPEAGKKMPDDANAAIDEPQQQAAVYLLQGDSRGILVLDEDRQRWNSLSRIPGGEDVVAEPNNVNCGPILGRNWFGVSQRIPLQISTRSQGYVATVKGPSLLRLQAGSSGGLDVISGRMMIRVDANAAWNEASLPHLNLGPGTLGTHLTLLEPDTRLAVEVSPVSMESNPADADDAAVVRVTMPDSSDLQVSVTILEGSVLMRMPEKEDVPLRNGQRASWLTLGSLTQSSLVVDNGEPLTSAPSWHFEQEPQTATASSNTDGKLLEALSKPGEPCEAVLPLLDDRNPQVGVLAVEVLSLIRDSDHLMSILFEARDETIHRAAIDGLSEIASSSPKARQAIVKSLETRIPKAETEPMMQLLLGLSESQASDPAVAADLIAMLESDRLATRTLAIYRMEELTGDRRGFHPEAEQVRRRDAVKRWRRYVEQNNGRLIP